jgi:hypothetical protein
MSTNPYAALYAQKLGTPPTAPTVAATGTSAAEPSMLQTIGTGAMNFGKGLVKGAGNTIRGIGNLESKIPGVKSLMPGDVQDYLGSEGENANQPHGIMQTLGKGVEQAGEFMLPGGAEEKAVSMLPKAAQTAGRIGASALSSGIVNKLQGGGFGTGAAAGAGGALLGAGMQAAAPKIAEGALGIRAAMRGRGRDIGQAVLDETSGIRPETIADSAKNKISSLYGERQALLDNASVKPNPVKGLLPAPSQEIPLHQQPFTPGRLSEPIRLNQPYDPTQPITSTSIRNAPAEIHPAWDNPGQLKPNEYIGQRAGTYGGRQPTQGVLVRPGATGGGPIPETLPNNVASLRPARNVLSEAMGNARSMEAPTLHGQVSNMHDFLHTGAVSGEPIPANITPSRLGRLQQGFSDEHLTWNPATHEMANAAGQRAYGAMTGELARTAPETVPLNSRISNLIPAQRAADSISRNAGTTQRVLGRFGAHTGALTLGGVGAAGGYKEGGVPGAIAGGLTGVLAPELIASPEGQMIAARTLSKAGSLRPLAAAALQQDRKKEAK